MNRAVVLLALAGCYDPPQPLCGFRCGPASECPNQYTCGDDGYCRRAGAPADLSCPLLDAGVDAYDFFPFVIDFAPADNAIEVPHEVTLTVRFNEPMTGLTATSFVLVAEGMTTPIAATISYNASSRTASLDPDAPLAGSTDFFVALGDEITDLTGNKLTARRGWTFETARDSTPPMLVDHTPASDATNLPVDTIFTATFSEQVTNLTTANFFVEDSSGPIAGSIGFVSLTAVKFTPTSLAPNTVYTARLTSGITDFAGNPLAPFAWAIETGDDAFAPTLISRSPIANETDVAVTATISARFNEPVANTQTGFTLEQAGTPVPTTHLYFSSSNTTRLTPTAPLAANTIYTAKLSAAITDTSSNALVPLTWTFTTAP